MHNNKVVFYRTISAVAATSLVLGATPLAHAATNTPKGSGETSVTAHMGGNADIPISLLQGNNIVETANTDESGTVTLSTKGGENTSTNLELQLPEEYTISNATCVAENPDNGTTSQDIPLANTTPQNVTSPNTDTEEQKSPQDEFYEEAKEVMFADIETNPYNFDPVKTLQFALENGLIEAKDSFPEQYRVGYTPTQAEDSEPPSETPSETPNETQAENVPEMALNAEEINWSAVSAAIKDKTLKVGGDDGELYSFFDVTSKAEAPDVITALHKLALNAMIHDIKAFEPPVPRELFDKVLEKANITPPIPLAEPDEPNALGTYPLSTLNAHGGVIYGTGDNSTGQVLADTYKAQKSDDQLLYAKRLAELKKIFAERWRIADDKLGGALGELLDSATEVLSGLSNLSGVTALAEPIVGVAAPIAGTALGAAVPGAAAAGTALGAAAPAVGVAADALGKTIDIVVPAFAKLANETGGQLIESDKGKAIQGLYDVWGQIEWFENQLGIQPSEELANMNETINAVSDQIQTENTTPNTGQQTLTVDYSGNTVSFDAPIGSNISCDVTVNTSDEDSDKELRNNDSSEDTTVNEASESDSSEQESPEDKQDTNTTESASEGTTVDTGGNTIHSIVSKFKSLF